MKNRYPAKHFKDKALLRSNKRMLASLSEKLVPKYMEEPKSSRMTKEERYHYERGFNDAMASKLYDPIVTNSDSMKSLYSFGYKDGHNKICEMRLTGQVKNEGLTFKQGI